MTNLTQSYLWQVAQHAKAGSRGGTQPLHRQWQWSFHGHNRATGDSKLTNALYFDANVQHTPFCLWIFTFFAARHDSIELTYVNFDWVFCSGIVQYNALAVFVFTHFQFFADHSTLGTNYLTETVCEFLWIRFKNVLHLVIALYSHVVGCCCGFMLKVWI